MALGSSVMDIVPTHQLINLHNTCSESSGSSKDYKWAKFIMDNPCLEQNENLISHNGDNPLNGQPPNNMGSTHWDVFGIETDGVIDVETTRLSEDNVSSTTSEIQAETNGSETLSNEKFEMENSNDSQIESELQSKRTKRKRSKNSQEDDIPDLGYELVNAYKILQHLMSPSYRAINHYFIDPVTIGKFDYNDYHEIISKPMWLSKVRSELLEGGYSNITEFVRDVRLILENCYRYHGPHHPVTKKALKLETLLEQKLALLPRDIKEKTAIEVTSLELIESAGFKGVGRQRIPRLTMGDTSLVLQYVNHAKAQREREAKRRHLEEKKAEKEAEYIEILEWETKLLEKDESLMKSMWELPQIGHFLFLAQKVLNIPEVPQFMLERMFFMPKESVCLATVMTSLLSSPQQRTMLDQKPPMPYRIWNARLKAKVQVWYKIFQNKGKNLIKVFESIGIEPDFFRILGDTNPYEKKSFHELIIYQRVWLLKSLCDYCLHNHKTVQEAVNENSLADQKDYLLGEDRSGNTYLHFPQFCGQDLRIYRQAYCEEPPVVRAMLSSINTCDKEEVPASNLGALSENVNEVDDTDKDTGNKEIMLKENNPNSKKDNKEVPSKNADDETKNVQESRKEDSKSKDNELPNEVESTTKESLLSNGITKENAETDTKEKETITNALACSIQPDSNLFKLVVDNVESLRQLIDEINGKRGSSEIPRKRRKGRPPAVPQCEVELKENLGNLLAELEPWEGKLLQAAKRMRIRLRKEWDDYQAESLKKQAEKETDIWESEPEEEKPSTSANSSQDEKSGASEASSSSDEEEIKQTSKKKKIIKDEKENESGESDSSDSNSNVRCLRKRKIRTDKNVTRVRHRRSVKKENKRVSHFACNTDSEAQGQYYWETLRQIIVSSNKKDPSENKNFNSEESQTPIKSDTCIPALSSSLINSNVIKGGKVQNSSNTSSSSTYRRRIFTSRNKTNPDFLTSPNQAIQLNVKNQSVIQNIPVAVVSRAINVNEDNRIIKTYISSPGVGHKNSDDLIFQENKVSLLKQALKQHLHPQASQTFKGTLNNKSSQPPNMNVHLMRGSLKKKLNSSSSQDKNTVVTSQSSVFTECKALKTYVNSSPQQMQKNNTNSTILPTSLCSDVSAPEMRSSTDLSVQTCNLVTTTTANIQTQQVRQTTVQQLQTSLGNASSVSAQPSIKLIPAVTQDGKRVFLQYVTGHTSLHENSNVIGQIQNTSSFVKARQPQTQNKKSPDAPSILGNLLSQTEHNTTQPLFTQQIHLPNKNNNVIDVSQDNGIPNSDINMSVVSTHSTSQPATASYISLAPANGHNFINSPAAASLSSPSSVASVAGNSISQNSKIITMPLSQFLQQNNSKFTAVPTSDGQKIILTLVPKSPNSNHASAESNVSAAHTTNSISQVAFSAGLQNQTPLFSPQTFGKTGCASSTEPPPLGPITQKKIFDDGTSRNMINNGLLSQTSQATAINTAFSTIHPPTKVPSQLPPLAYISSPIRFQNSHLASTPSAKATPAELQNKIFTGSRLSEVPSTQGISLMPFNKLSTNAHQSVSAQHSINEQVISSAPSQQKTINVNNAFNVKHSTTNTIPTQSLQSLHPQSQNVSFQKMNTVILQAASVLPTSKSSLRSQDVSPVKMMILTTPNSTSLPTVSLHKETNHLSNVGSHITSANSDKKMYKILPKQPVHPTQNEVVTYASSPTFVRKILPASQSIVAMQNEIVNKQNVLPVVATSVIGAGNLQVLNKSVNTPFKGETSLVLVNENRQLVLGSQYVSQYPELDRVTEYINHNAM